MKRLAMKRYLGALALGAALLAPAGIQAQDRRYYDGDRRDYHVWNNQEDRAYRHYLEERHEKYRDWHKTNKAQQRAYWKWRHDHMDWR